MRLSEAEALALDLVRQMQPHCVKVEIAGSIRRRRPDVKDLEIVAIPRRDQVRDETDLFQEQMVEINLLYTDWALDSGIRWIKPNSPGEVDWRLRPTAQIWKGVLPGGAKLDLFLATEVSWGYDLAIRTGSAEFSQALVTHARKIGLRCQGGFLLDGNGFVIPTREERDFFTALRLEWVEPEQRLGWNSLRPLA